MPLREVISQFKNAGLGSIPGGGGEILVDGVRKRISPLKNQQRRMAGGDAGGAYELGLNRAPR